MIINIGEKLHVMRRRSFDGDLRRHFAGVVTEVEGATVRLQGYAFIYDEANNRYVRKPERRVTIIDVGNCGYVVNLIPSSVEIESLSYVKAYEKNLAITDGAEFSLDVNEFTASR